jgi:hypothetical protein
MKYLGGIKIYYEAAFYEGHNSDVKISSKDEVDENPWLPSDLITWR